MRPSPFFKLYGFLFALSCLLSSTALAQAPEVQHATVTLSAAELARQPQPTSFKIAVPLRQAEPFLAVGVTWQAADPAAAALRLQVRASADGNRWSEWVELATDHDAAETPGKFATALAFFNADTRLLEVRFKLAAASALPLEQLHFHFISPGATPRTLSERIHRKAMSQAQEELQQPTSNYPKPPVITRTEWGCPDGQVTTHGTLSYTTVTHLIVHHTATGNSAANNDWAAVIRSIWNFHIFTNGWADIGYNYLIDPNGVIYEGRAGGDNVQGAHFSGVNGGTMGISMVGTFTDVTPGESQINSLRRLLAWKASQRAIDPTGKARHAASGLDLNNISGHRDGPGSTECPGNALYPLLPTVRAGVKELLNTPTAVASVSAASFAAAALASETIVATFGANLASEVVTAASTPLPTNLGGTSVTVRDSTNKEFLAPLFFVSPGQINFLMPSGLALGPATVLVTNAQGQLASSAISLEAVAPALFAANANGREAAAAVVLRVKADGTQTYEPAAIYDAAQSKFLPAPIAVNQPGEQVFLVAFGTGLRNRSSLTNVAAKVGGVDVPALFVGAVEGLAGLDQVNSRLPSSLAGRGEVELQLSVDGKAANPLRLRIQ